MFDYYEFFAGGGMARAGLGASWRCLFANDFDLKKVKTYQENWGAKEIHAADVGSLQISDLPGIADLVWASFPCQDLSLAGGGAGLKGDRSGTFWPFWKRVCELVADKRAPKLIVLENVYGALTSHDGADFVAIANAFSELNYQFGALVIDARLFLPQSRPRLFIIGVHSDIEIPGRLKTSAPEIWHPAALIKAHRKLLKQTAGKWTWWHLPVPSKRNTTLSNLIDDNPSGVEWHTQSETDHLLKMMSPINFQKVTAAQKLGRRIAGGIYKRTRLDEHGGKIQRAEVRFDDIAGCLRTPAGGSSRQTIIVVDGKKIRSRLLAPREAARLMGLPEDYKLPTNYNEAYHLVGDGVAVPVVRHLAENILEPLLGEKHSRSKFAA